MTKSSPVRIIRRQAFKELASIVLAAPQEERMKPEPVKADPAETAVELDITQKLRNQSGQEVMLVTQLKDGWLVFETPNGFMYRVNKCGFDKTGQQRIFPPMDRVKRGRYRQEFVKDERVIVMRQDVRAGPNFISGRVIGIDEKDGHRNGLVKVLPDEKYKSDVHPKGGKSYMLVSHRMIFKTHKECGERIDELLTQWTTFEFHKNKEATTEGV